MQEFAGEFETHLTVDLKGRDGGGGALRAWGAARGMKCTHIVLARGRSVSQPMLSRGAALRIVDWDSFVFGIPVDSRRR